MPRKTTTCRLDQYKRRLKARVKWMRARLSTPQVEAGVYSCRAYELYLAETAPNKTGSAVTAGTIRKKIPKREHSGPAHTPYPPNPGLSRPAVWQVTLQETVLLPALS
jgi:hypothetical protein